MVYKLYSLIQNYKNNKFSQRENQPIFLNAYRGNLKNPGKGDFRGVNVKEGFFMIILITYKEV